MTKLTLWIVVGAVVLGGAWYFWPNTAETPKPSVSPVPSGSVASPQKTTTPTLTVTPIPTITVATPPTPTETPGLIVQEVRAYTVTIQNSAFTPSPLTIKRGDVVIFQNVSGFMQTVTALNKMFDSKNLPTGQEWQLETANLSPGTYEYKSTLHTSIRGTLMIQ
jgi:plastocyanin